MELKVYLRILARRWWIVVPTLLLTFAATLALTFNEAPLYASSATFVLKLGSAFQDDKDFVSALDILSRRAEIAATYTEVATSRLIKRQAAELLQLTPEQRSALSVSSRALGGTNVVEISVEGLDPTLVRDFTNAVGAQTIAYVRGLYETYELEPLDEAVLRTTPISPNYPLNLGLGAALGLCLGIGMALLAEYLRAQPEEQATFNILDHETGMYSKRYFLVRLRQELSRASRNHSAVSIALMNVDHHGVMDGASPQFRSTALRRLLLLLGPVLREEDIMAHYDDTVIAFLLPDLHGEPAKELIELMRTRIAAAPLELEERGMRLNLQAAAGVVTYHNKDVDVDDLLAGASRALEGAESAAYDRVHLLTEGSSRRRSGGSRAKTNGVRP
jgi:diguanylate cyclase (GGDEF)-like protein